MNSVEAYRRSLEQANSEVIAYGLAGYEPSIIMPSETVIKGAFELPDAAFSYYSSEEISWLTAIAGCETTGAGLALFLCEQLVQHRPTELLRGVVESISLLELLFDEREMAVGRFVLKEVLKDPKDA